MFIISYNLYFELEDLSRAERTERARATWNVGSAPLFPRLFVQVKPKSWMCPMLCIVCPKPWALYTKYPYTPSDPVHPYTPSDPVHPYTLNAEA